MYLEGSIAWLPPRQDIPPEHFLGAEALDDGCFNHPVLILAADNARNEVVMLIITSFGGKDLEERHPKSTRVRSQYLPIYPSKEHPENGMRLFLADNERLFKNSYVTIKPCRTIKTTILRRWRNGKYRLGDDSLHELVEHIDFESPWPKTIQTPSPVRAMRPVQYTPPEWVHQYVVQPATIPTGYYPTTYTSTPPVRAAHSDYHVPVQWTTPSYSYSRYESTPPLHSNNIFESSSSPSDDEISACGAFTRVIVVIAALVGAAWYFNLF